MEKIMVSDYEEIMEVVGKYTEGCRKGDTALMKQAFDKGATMYGYLNGQLYDGSIENLYAAVDALGGDEASRTRIDVLEVQGNAAAVRVTLEDWHQIAFTDFHSLLKMDGQWKIVGKVFHQY